MNGYAWVWGPLIRHNSGMTQAGDMAGTCVTCDQMNRRECVCVFLAPIEGVVCGGHTHAGRM